MFLIGFVTAGASAKEDLPFILKPDTSSQKIDLP